MVIIDGNHLAETEQNTLKNQLLTLNITPSLHVILVGNLSPSQIYVKRKEEACKRVGIKSTTHKFPDSITTIELCAFINTLNQDDTVDGILVQLPLPKSIDTESIIETIHPKKDVDGLTSQNLGNLLLKRPGIIPCTPKGCLDLILSFKNDIKGLHAVIVGRSSLVGKPLAHLLLNHDLTTTVCHSKSKNLKTITTQADILISAIGKPLFITKDYVKPGAIVIDVGITRMDGLIQGDVDFQHVKEITSAITPVPGGVGPMTVTNLLKNTLKCYKLNHDKFPPFHQ